MVMLRFLPMILFLLTVPGISHGIAQAEPPIPFPTGSVALSDDDSARSDQSVQRGFNESSAVATAFIRAYQELISSQDRPACLFSVSCSHFAGQAIRRTGLIRGVLLSADRLLRCNHLAEDYYEIDPVSGRALDPILETIVNGK